jgi:hypothetical protein
VAARAADPPGGRSDLISATRRGHDDDAHAARTTKSSPQRDSSKRERRDSNPRPPGVTGRGRPKRRGTTEDDEPPFQTQSGAIRSDAPLCRAECHESVWATAVQARTVPLEPGDRGRKRAIDSTAELTDLITSSVSLTRGGGGALRRDVEPHGLASVKVVVQGWVCRSRSRDRPAERRRRDHDRHQRIDARSHNEHLLQSPHGSCRATLSQGGGRCNWRLRKSLRYRRKPAPKPPRVTQTAMMSGGDARVKLNA